MTIKQQRVNTSSSTLQTHPHTPPDGNANPKKRTNKKKHHAGNNQQVCKNCQRALAKYANQCTGKWQIQF